MLASLSRTQTTQDLGRHIFIYSNIRTNQVVYSLRRPLNNNDALRQLPFLGKKSVPASLRKDIWRPMAIVLFPRPVQGLLAFQKLREYRKLHELSYPVEDFKDDRHPNAMLEKKKRGRKLMDQKANTVADLAATLQKQDEAGQAYHQQKEKAYEEKGPSLETALKELEASHDRQLTALEGRQKGARKFSIPVTDEDRKKSVQHRTNALKTLEKQQLLAQREVRDQQSEERRRTPLEGEEREARLEFQRRFRHDRGDAQDKEWQRVWDSYRDPIAVREMIQKEELSQRQATAIAALREKHLPSPRGTVIEGVDGVVVQWADLLDAEYAETWPKAVVHHRLRPTRHTAPQPRVRTPSPEQVPEKSIV
ncbi:MAG: hypothetical protein M1817_005791 [Caeruleum heppii]|nr:MAG: hypothetical protein M1817_005791 [Caeruleum heppii]